MENPTLDKEVEEEIELCDWCDEKGDFYIEDFFVCKNHVADAKHRVWLRRYK